ncbi:MAG: hypothetical protein ACLFUJ_14415 [Phycisphaerae bacterium]
MVYRIRYHDATGQGETEAVVEANSPTEAMVKFRCIYNTREFEAEMPEVVTSVSDDSQGW